MIPLMENKMKWDRSKKKKYPGTETDMSGGVRYNRNDAKPTDEETSIPMFQIRTSDSPSPSRGAREHSINLHSGDSGIESVQVSPSQKALNKASSSTIDVYELPGPSTSRRYSSVYLHPDRALFNYSNAVASSSQDHYSLEDGDLMVDGPGGGGDNLSAASSNASSTTSVAADSGPGFGGYRHADPWGRRRSSTWTGRYSDSADPEFANLRLAARGSVGMHSLSDSLHRLTFTQSLAFPELARKLATRRRQQQLRAAINERSQADFEACSKFVAVTGVFLLSIVVYGVVHRYAKV